MVFILVFFLSQKVPGHHAQELSYIRLDLVFVINEYKASPTDRLFFICLFIRRFFIIIIVNRYLLICFLFFVFVFVFVFGFFLCGGGGYVTAVYIKIFAAIKIAKLTRTEISYSFMNQSI